MTSACLASKSCTELGPAQPQLVSKHFPSSQVNCPSSQPLRRRISELVSPSLQASNEKATDHLLTTKSMKILRFIAALKMESPSPVCTAFNSFANIRWLGIHLTNKFATWRWSWMEYWTTMLTYYLETWIFLDQKS